MPQISPISWVNLSCTIIITISVISLLNVTNPTNTDNNDITLNKNTLNWSW